MGGLQKGASGDDVLSHVDDDCISHMLVLYPRSPQNKYHIKAAMRVALTPSVYLWRVWVKVTFRSQASTPYRCREALWNWPAAMHPHLGRVVSSAYQLIPSQRHFAGRCAPFTLYRYFLKLLFE